MAIDVSWLNEGTPLLAFALVFFLAYAIIAKTKILGESKAINSIISLILAIIFITFSSVREYLLNITPWFIVFLTVLFFFLLIIAFMIKSDDWNKFTKPITIVFIILLALTLIIAVFYTFPSTQALLPGKISGSSCSTGTINYDSYDSSDCYKKDGYWKCYQNNNRDYETYDTCSKKSSGYRCYDYNSADNSCYDNNGKDIFEKIGNWFYQKRITNAFWLILTGIIAMIVVIKAK